MEATRAAADDGLYDRDYFSWTQQQAEHLRCGRFEDIDLENVAEEIESLGKSQLSALTSSYKLIALHLLTFLVQPDKTSANWAVTISRERGNLVLLLDDNRGLKPKRAERFAKAYAVARRNAAIETGLPLDRFPTEPPFTVDEIEADDMWPAAARSIIALQAK